MHVFHRVHLQQNLCYFILFDLEADSTLQSKLVHDAIEVGRTFASTSAEHEICEEGLTVFSPHFGDVSTF
jgi:hypothetical protein